MQDYLICWVSWPECTNQDLGAPKSETQGAVAILMAAFCIG